MVEDLLRDCEWCIVVLVDQLPSFADVAALAATSRNYQYLWYYLQYHRKSYSAWLIQAECGGTGSTYGRIAPTTTPSIVHAPSHGDGPRTE